MSDMLREMRKTLEKHARIPFGIPDCAKIYAEHPAEAEELLHRLFEAYDAGEAVEPDIRALITLIRGSRKYVSAKRSEALHKMDVLRAAYNYPPTSRRLMFLALRGAVHAGEPIEPVEKLVREYTEVAQSLLVQLLREQRHDKFYEVSPNGWLDTTADIDALRAMIARAECNRILSEMGVL